jgi:hypothetical protein
VVKHLRNFGAGALALALGLALAGLPSLAFAQTGDDGSGAILGGGLFSCICGLIWLAVEIGIAYWVYNDAKKRGNPNAILWAVLTFFFTLLGLILYFLIGRNQGTSAGGTPPSTPGGAARY